MVAAAALASAPRAGRRPRLSSAPLAPGNSHARDLWKISNIIYVNDPGGAHGPRNAAERNSGMPSHSVTRRSAPLAAPHRSSAAAGTCRATHRLRENKIAAALPSTGGSDDNRIATSSMTRTSATWETL